MRLLAAPDKFKDAIDAREAVEAIAGGVREARPEAEIDLCPLADGGEGTGALLAAAVRAVAEESPVFDPLGRPRHATWWRIEHTDRAIVEMARASGLAMLSSEERRPLETTSFGTGQLLRAAISRGCRRILLGVGGSATVDGGAGCLQALGWRLLDAAGRPIETSATGATLADVRSARPPESLPDLDLTVLCDVDNPLIGPRGAARVFAPQKGATPRQVATLDANLRQWADVLQKLRDANAKRRPAEVDPVASIPHGGAAGGIAAGLHAALGAKLVSGFDEVARAVRLRERIVAADMILTGEGRLDAQTGGGKVVAGVAKLATACGRPVVAFVGAIETPDRRQPSDESKPADADATGGIAAQLGLDEVVVITPPATPLAEALRGTADNLRTAVARWIRERG